MSQAPDSRIRLMAPLGHGGMSDVWLGALRGPAGFSKLVAVKQLRMVGNAEYDGGAAFLREARLAALLNHPNIVHTFEVLAQGGDYRIVMEFLEGQPLNRILRKNAPISLRDYVRVVADLLAGLHHAHELADFDGSPMRVVHLDVSPQNVFVTWEGMVKLLDFGIASFGRVSHADDGLVKGKLSYMAPEQARGEPVDRRTDVFAAGSVLFEILAGTPMWGGMSEAQVVHGLGHGIIPSIDDRAPTAPEPLRLIVRKATAPNPKGRFTTAEVMREALEHWLEISGGRPNPRVLGDRISEAFAADRERIKLLVAQGRAADDGIEHTDLFAPTPSARRMVDAPEEEVPPEEPPGVVMSFLVPVGGALGAIGLGLVGAGLLLVATVVAAYWVQSTPVVGEVRPATPGCPEGPRPVVELSGAITESAVLGCARDYRLVGLVEVQPGVTLTLEAGSVVEGAQGSVLLVRPGGRLVADGKADAPIVFTSDQEKPAAGDWGGLVVLGKAPTNMADPRFKGLRPEGDLFGGELPADDSGVLRYVRIEYAGTVLAPNNETNGLTFAGVGSGTVVDHVQVRDAGDDCFEWFGGTVNASHLVCTNPGDDAFDIEFGYTGRLSSLVLVDRGTPSPDHDGFEVDNDAARFDAAPRTAPTVEGATLCGPGALGGYGLVVRRGAAGTYRGLWVDGLAAVLDLRDTPTELSVSDVIVGAGTPLGPTEDGGEGPLRADDDGGRDDAAAVTQSRPGGACGSPPVGPGGLVDRWDRGWVVW